MDTRFGRRGLSATVVFVAVAVFFGLAGSAWAVRPGTAGPAKKASVVRELSELRTATSSTYLLSDGARRVVISATPTHFKDGSGRWQSYDTTLGLRGPGQYGAASLPFGVSLVANPLGTPAASISDSGYAIGFRLSGVSEDGGLASGSELTFPALAPGAAENYRVLPAGIEQSITLSAASAPASYTCIVSHAGLTLKRDATGAWGFYASKATKPLALLSSLTVLDASRNAAGLAAYADGAEMTVIPGRGQSVLTYTVPRAWLDDPARVFPVTIDPMAYFPTYNPSVDTSIYSGPPNTSYGSATQLTVGNDGTGFWRSLVRYDLSAIPTNAYVYSADLELYKSYSGGSNGTKTVAAVNQSWSGSSTWSSLGCTVNSFPAGFATSLGTVASQGSGGWYDCWTKDVDYTVQRWISGAQTNNGFAFWQDESGGQGAAYLSKFNSQDNSANKPYLQLEYEVAPTMTLSLDKTNYRVGDPITATMTVNTNFPYDVQEEKILINHSKGSSSYRGLLGWFRFDPNTYNADGVSWVTRPIDFGYLAYEATPGSTYGTQYITPDLAGSTYHVLGGGYWQIVWKLSANANFGNLQANDFGTYFALDCNSPVSSSGSESWVSGWQNQTAPTFDLKPKPVTALSFTTTANSTWWNPTSGNDDTNGQGRGSVTLNWPAAPGADGYNVMLFDGYQYDQVGTTTTTSWSSAGKGIYPSDTQIAAITQGSTANPFLSGSGLDLRDNPNALYQRMGGTTASKLATAYRFIVQPYNSIAGALQIGENMPLTVTLDNRSLPPSSGAGNDPQYSTYDLGGWDSHSATAVLNTGDLELDITDLAIASYGPDASVSRSYLSSSTTGGNFAPGWFFNYQQNLVVNGSTATYTDTAQQQHALRLVNGVWLTPNGFQATLSRVGSNWKLLFFYDQSYLTFNSSGTLLSETDHDGNQTTYAWNSGNLTITAANGQTITVTRSAGKIQSAVYTTSAGTREVDYTTASPWQVTYFPNTTSARVVVYGYNATPALTSITQNNWPSTGNSAQEGFAYSGGKLANVYYPDYYSPYSHADAHADLTYATGQATVIRYGTVGGTANQQINKEVYTFESTGQPLTRAVGVSNPVTWTYTYAFNLQEGSETASDGTQTAYGISTAGDTLAEDQASNALASMNQRKTYVYDSSHRMSSETDYRTPVTYVTTNYSYNTNGDPTDTQQVGSDSGVYKDFICSYDSAGRVTSEQDMLSGPPKPATGGTYAEADYSSFATNGSPQTTIYKNVQLSYGGAQQDLTVTEDYDAFGNLLTKTDWSNSRVIETNTYDIAGNKLTSTDANATVTNSSYDVLGNQSATWLSASGTSQKDNYVATTYDPLGRVLTETTKTSDAGGNLTTVKVVTKTYDGAGNQLTTSDSTVAGQSGKAVYDDRANATQQWDTGAADYSNSRSTRDAFDGQGNVTGESLPGNSAAAGATGSQQATYATTGSDIAQTNPDGSWQKTSYDGTDAVVAATVPSSGYDQTDSPGSIGTTTNSYTLDGQLASSTTPPSDAAGLTTSYAYDKAGEQTSAQASSQAATTTDYNNSNMLGWVVRAVDKSGVTTSYTYDTHGCVESKQVGSKTTTSTYDAANRLRTQTDADSNVLTNTYDAFGNLIEAKHQNGSTVLKDVQITVDSLGRPTDQTDTVTGLRHTWTYPVNSATGVQETESYDATPLTSTQITRNSRNVETSRVTTIASGTTVTRSVADSTSGRDAADRWIGASIQLSGQAAITESRVIDSAGRLQSQSGAGYTAGNSASYTYDAATGRKTDDTIPLSLGGTIADTKIRYYPNGRLESGTFGGCAVFCSWDSYGNLVADNFNTMVRTFTYDSANRLTQSTTNGAVTVYGWDQANGWRTSQGPSGSPNQVQYGYNAQGRMTSYSNSATSTTATYAYDALGQRTRSSVTQGSASWTEDWIYDGSRLMSLKGTQGSSTYRIDYLYDEEGALYGGAYRSPATSASATYFSIVTNDHGDVLELLDGAGNAFAAYRYTPWGTLNGSGNYDTGIWTQGTSLVSSTLAGHIVDWQALMYAGYVYDPESSLYYCTARYYDPWTRQWTTADPAKADGEESAYQYCAGDPVERTDHSGKRLDPGDGYASCMRCFHAVITGLNLTVFRFQFAAYWKCDGKNVWGAYGTVYRYWVIAPGKPAGLVWLYAGYYHNKDTFCSWGGQAHGRCVTGVTLRTYEEIADYYPVVSMTISANNVCSMTVSETSSALSWYRPWS
jgi:RHS repeat-associated protein